jgi:hypothetical protein
MYLHKIRTSPHTLLLAIQNSLIKNSRTSHWGDELAGPVLLYSPRFHSSASVALALIDVNQRGSIGLAAETTLRQTRDSNSERVLWGMD